MHCAPASGNRVGKGIVGIAACILFIALNLAAKGEQIFKGEITDSKCAALGSHATMLDKGETNAQCTIACVKMGAKYVLADPQNKLVYQLDDQKKPEAFAAQNVLIVGTLDQSTGTIHVVDIVRGIPPKVKQAKTVSIVCDACPRGMAKARRAAFEQLSDWNRFAVVPDPTKADLVLLISANPYLGDYLTREGPDARPAPVNTTYMNVVDPRTGVSLWSDSDRSGSWFVSKATKDLIVEFRAQLEADESPAERQVFMDRHLTPKADASPGK
jgi:hypothetical protein